MPKNKDALIRYRIINNCLLNGKIKTKEEIIRQYHETLGKEISERTFAEDIRTMKEDKELGYLSPIVFDKVEKGYYYSDKNYSIDNIPLSAEEIEALSFASTLLDQYKRIGIFGKFTGAVGKIVDLVKIRRKIESDHFEQFVEFEDAPVVKGSEYIEPLFLSIKQKKVLSIEYQSFSSLRPKKYQLHPYYLKEYRNRWYLIGLEEEKQSIITLGLERIVHIEEIANVFFISKNFNPKEYFGNILGISVSNVKNTPEEIIIRFTSQQTLYVKTQPLHHSQQIISENEDGSVMKFHLCTNYELKSYILSLGKGCEVLKPESLRIEIGIMAKEVFDLYK
ncbi:MAG TPA: WYL domain-containing protein [Cytophagaceae bacterium]|jgi:predicted DNA-binding transcriptional regulator YafY|nr:WYL domain-containing protein [Cytophagaceae bacterium]